MLCERLIQSGCPTKCQERSKRIYTQFHVNDEAHLDQKCDKKCSDFSKVKCDKK